MASPPSRAGASIPPPSMQLAAFALPHLSLLKRSELVWVQLLGSGRGRNYPLGSAFVDALFDAIRAGSSSSSSYLPIFAGTCRSSESHLLDSSNY